MNWIRVSVDLATHPKSLLLAAATGEPFAWALMVRLWSWMAEYADAGFIDEARQPIAEKACGWCGERGAFLRAAASVGLAKFADTNWCAHDWNEYQGAAIRQAKRLAKKQKAYRKRQRAHRRSVTGNVTVTATATLPVTRRNVTRRNVTRQKEEEEASRSATSPPATEGYTRRPETLSVSPAVGVSVLEVFEHYRTTFKAKQLIASHDQCELIGARLQDGYSVDDLKRAITGLSRSDWHTRNGQVRLEGALKDGERVENCWRWLEHPPDQEPTKGRASEADRDWTRPIEVDADGQAVL